MTPEIINNHLAIFFAAGAALAFVGVICVFAASALSSTQNKDQDDEGQ